MSSGVLIKLNGIEVPQANVEGEQGIKVTLSANKTRSGGGPMKRQPTTLTFYNEQWDLINSELIVPLDGKLRKLPIEIYDVCEGLPPFLLFKGVVPGDGLRWCRGICKVEADCVEETSDSEKMDCLRSTLVWDNTNGFLSQAHPKMVYCDELRPEWLQWVILITGILLLLIFILVYPIVLVISAIVSALNAIPGVNIDFDGDPDTNTLDWWNNLYNEMKLRIIGCGRRHPSPLLRSYVNNVCTICGTTFKSSIFTNPASDYFNTVYFNADSKKGLKAGDPETFIYENRPNETLDVFLDRVCEVVNGRWRLENGIVRLERRDKLQPLTAWVSVEELDTEKRLVEGPCFEWDKADKPGLLEISYLPDGLDITANEAGDKYSEDVLWNDPHSTLQRGIMTKQFRFGAARFRNDGVEQDVLSQFTWYPPLEGAINEHKYALLLSKGIAANPKLLIWDGNDVNFGLVRRYNIPGWGVANDYNWPYQLNLHNVTPHTEYPTTQPNMALYGRFHAIDDPRVTVGRGYTFDMTFSYSRQHLIDMDIWKFIEMAEGAGEIGEITIDPVGKTIFVTGTV